MKKKLLTVLLISEIVCIALCFISWIAALIFALCAIIVLQGLVVFCICNKLVLKSNWLQNNYIYTESNQFISNAGYRTNLNRNYVVANLGSNPALFALKYPVGVGLNWSTGAQGLDMDFEILKYYHSYVKENGTIIIPIMPFSFVSQYLTSKKNYCDALYYSKFEKVLDWSQVPNIPLKKEREILKKWPLLLYPKSIKYIFSDCWTDNRFEISEMNMTPDEIENDSNFWIKYWFKEFDITSLSDFQHQSWSGYIDDARNILRRMIDFCLERNLRPVILCTPMTIQLRSMFTESDWSFMVTDFVKSVNREVLFIDYSNVSEFQDCRLYFNALFLNSVGRKKFSERVLSDLGILEKLDLICS